jgi:hypothetical protein
VCCDICRINGGLKYGKCQYFGMVEAEVLRMMTGRAAKNEDRV